MDLKSVIDTRRRGEVDLFLFVAVFVLAGIGLAMSYSASAVYAMNEFNDSLYFLKKQAVWFVLGFITLLVVQAIDYRKYYSWTKVMLAVSLVLLVIILIPGIGHSVKGSSRWFSLGPVSIQPSEFVKVAIVIYLAKVFSFQSNEGYMIQVLIPIIIIAVMFILIMLQPDFGTAMGLLMVSAVILFVSGFPLLYILSLSLISVPMFYLLIYQVDYRRERLLAYLDPWKNRYETGYHVIQSFIAFKKGGFFGTGLGNSTQKVSRLPEPHTDFIFAVIAEEVGLFGTALMVLLYLSIFWRGMVISLQAPDQFGKLLAIGLSLLIVVQAYVNIGVVTGTLPTTGITLPFISYGGSSLLSNMIAAGILLNISRFREVAHEGISASEEVWE